jgi:hypothetical protein
MRREEYAMKLDDMNNYLSMTNFASVKLSELTIKFTVDGEEKTYWACFMQTIGTIILWKSYEPERNVIHYQKLDINDIKMYNNGVRTVRLNGKAYQHHRLLALAHVPNDDPEHKKYVTKKDPTKDFVPSYNLKWVTEKEVKEKIKDAGHYNVKHQNYGRYYASLQCFLKPDGEWIKMTWDEYINYVSQTRGVKVAKSIQRKHDSYLKLRSERMDKKRTNY